MSNRRKIKSKRQHKRRGRKVLRAIKPPNTPTRKDRQSVVRMDFGP